MLSELATAGALALAIGASAQTDAQRGASAPAPALHYAFSAKIFLLAPIEQGTVDGRRMRFIPISGGTVYGPRLQGAVLAGGGDWQAIGPGGLTEVSARYTLKTTDGTVIDVVNAGVRVASEAVTEQIARGEAVDPGAYYFRTVPRLTVAAGNQEWLRRTLFVARGIRRPDHVVIDFYAVD